MMWTRGFFDVLCRRGEKQKWEGLVDTSFRFALSTRDGFIDITHIPSGKRVASTTSLPAADRVVHQLIDLPNVDWAKPDLEFSDVELVTLHAIVTRS